jgi:formate-dependent nitrite reductase cytochrome c552 subunit
MKPWHPYGLGLGLALAALLAPASAPCRADPGSEPARRRVESCVGCHSDPDFLVTHPKLYEYYRDWETSIHGQEEVTCSDCHGGDPETLDARQAHAEFQGENEARDALGFSKVHEVCGDCHDEIMDAYRESTHYAKLKEQKKGERHGPTCVTCHNSMNTLTLDVTTVEAACARCHNEETKIDAGVPEEARAALNKFLSIARFHRYIAARMDPAQSGLFFRKIDDRVTSLSVLWHTFELERIAGETQEVLDVMRRKRDEIREQRAATTPSTPEVPAQP